MTRRDSLRPKNRFEDVQMNAARVTQPIDVIRSNRISLVIIQANISNTKPKELELIELEKKN